MRVWNLEMNKKIYLGQDDCANTYFSKTISLNLVPLLAMKNKFLTFFNKKDGQ